MIRITRETDLGVLLLGALAEDGKGPSRSSRELGRQVGISAAMAGKILKRLARSGLANASRGAKGGYVRTRPLETISMADAVEALEGPIGLVDCVTDPGSCDHEDGCPSRVNWQRLNQVIADALHRVPISEMICDNTRDTPALLQLERGA